MARHPGDIDRSGFCLKPIRGAREGMWSIRISGNWRLTFRFEGHEVVDVDLVDYH